jgi:hypothetical protein
MNSSVSLIFPKPQRSALLLNPFDRLVGQTSQNLTHATVPATVEAILDAKVLVIGAGGICKIARDTNGGCVIAFVDG